MNRNIIYKDLGLIDYKEAWDYQEDLFGKIMEQKVHSRENPELKVDPAENYLLFCEHPHVFTLGKSGSEKNLLVDRDGLKRHNATFYRINRGGDITYHGPGQIVGYPILDLEKVELQIREYIYRLEETIIRTLNIYGMEGTRLEGATGVWLDVSDPERSKKICAIGVKASRHITMHGFALNVRTDLNYFNLINPCGIDDKGVTSMEKELGYIPDMERLKNQLKENFSDIFVLKIIHQK